jgi:hypothetical protein
MASLTLSDGETTLHFHFATMRTGEYTFEPVLDRSGRHYECTRVTLDIVAVVNRVAVATNKFSPRALGPGAAGDRLPFTLANVRDFIVRPRLRVTYEVDGVAVLDLPRELADGTRTNSDCKGGPTPQRATFTKISGDQTAILSYRVVCHDTYAEQFLMTNSWSLSCDINDYGMTTRVVRGQATFRKDLLDAFSLGPDDFRKHLIVPIGEGMRRVGVTVDENAAGDEIDYTVVDREVVTGLGSRNLAVEVNGSVTAGVDMALKDPKEIAGVIGNFMQGVGAGALAAIGLIGKAVPGVKLIGTARVIGRKGVNRQGLANMAVAWISDRFAPAVKNVHLITSLYVTHNVDTDHSPFAECRMEIMPLTMDLVHAVLSKRADVFFVSTSATYQILGDTFSGTTPGPNLPASENTRGTWLGQMVTQALGGPTASLPTSPPAASDATDVAAPF